MPSRTADRVRLAGPATKSARRVLTPDALDLVAALHGQFDDRRRELLDRRRERAERLAAGEPFVFLRETANVRRDAWRVAGAPPDLEDRRVEITGPVDRKMLINALNSGARVFMPKMPGV